MKFFQPKQAVFFGLFKEMAQSLKDISELYYTFSKDFKDFESYSKKAKDLEHQADEKTHRIIEHLNKTFITPFDREDIYTLAQELDDIVDYIENVIHDTYLFNIQQKNPAIDQFAPLIKQGAVHVENLIECLESQKYTERLMQEKIAMHKLEDQGDEIFSEAISKLFRNGQDAVTIIKDKAIIERLEKIVDKYQKVSDIIEGIIVKSS